jgi:hypothetical protein
MNRELRPRLASILLISAAIGAVTAFVPSTTAHAAAAERSTAATETAAVADNAAVADAADTAALATDAAASAVTTDAAASAVTTDAAASAVTTDAADGCDVSVSGNQDTFSTYTARITSNPCNVQVRAYAHCSVYVYPSTIYYVDTEGPTIDREGNSVAQCDQVSVGGGYEVNVNGNWVQHQLS